MMPKMIRSLGGSLAVCVLSAMTFAQHTYYISKSTGADSRSSTQAQSKSTPWAHLPGMASCSSNCASYTPHPGDSFVLMGCDVWVNSDFPVKWQWSGSSGSLIHIGVDQTWYNTTNCPSAWNRPVWDAQKTVMGGGGNNYFFNPNSNSPPDTNYVTLDNIEMTHLEITSGSEGNAILWLGMTSHDWTVSNNYIHAWDASADNCTLIEGPWGGGTSYNDVYEYNVIDGSDATISGGGSGRGVCYAFYTSYNGTKVLNNVIRYVVNPFVVSTDNTVGMEIGGNLIEYGLGSIGGSHCNMIETGGGLFYIHDNVIRNTQCGADETMWVGNAANEKDYVWNNVIYNLDGVGGAATPPEAGENYSGITVYFWDNTVVTPASNSDACLGLASGRNPTGMTVYGQNIHCVTEGSNAIDPSFANHGTLVANHNLAMSHATATKDGYTSSETYAYSPTSGTSPTVGQGTNLTSSWPSGYSTNDTQYGVSEQTINGVVEAVLARTTNTRPTGSSAWDIGAYEFDTQDPPPDPPSGLVAIVQ